MNPVPGVSTVSFELWCDYTGEPPIYRIYIDHFLMTERTYIWKNPDSYLIETIPLRTISGPHTLKIETTKRSCRFHIKKFAVNDVPKVLREHDMRFVLDPRDMR